MRFFLLFAFLLYAEKPALACEIEFHPPKVFVEFQGTASANCSASSCSDLQGMGWESSYGGTGLKEGVSSLELKINQITEWKFEPKCYTVSSDDSQKLKVLPITVYKMPDKVYMPEPKSPLKAPGDDFLQCDVVNVAPANKLTITWYKGNEIIYKGTFPDSHQTPVNESLLASMQVFPEDHGKEVWCEAKLDFLTAEHRPPMRSKTHVLTVWYPPTFDEPEDETQEISPGTKISLSCSATGNPTPVYSWQLADPTLEGIQEMNVTGPNLTLDFRVSGVVSCTASNAVGKTVKTFNLKTRQGNQTTLAAILGVFLTLGLLIAIGGVLFVTHTGSCSFKKGNYTPTSCGPV